MNYLQSATKSLFRWEALQEYGDDEEKDMSDWWDFIEEKKKTGVRMRRVRLISFPVTDYTRKEIEIHKLSSERGDDIRYILDAKTGNIQDHPDFWLIDDLVVLLMKYTDNGKYKGFEVVKGNLQEYLDFRDKVYRASESILTLKL